MNAKQEQVKQEHRWMLYKEKGKLLEKRYNQLHSPDGLRTPHWRRLPQSHRDIVRENIRHLFKVTANYILSFSTLEEREETITENSQERPFHKHG